MNIAKIYRLTSDRIPGSGEDFDLVFYHALNSVIRDINHQSMLTVDEIDEEDPPETVDIPVKYTNVVVDGVEFYMQRSARWARTSDEISDAIYRMGMNRLVTDVIMDEDVAVGFDYED
jgi:hypothetical protein